MLNAGVIGMGIGEKHALAYQNHRNTNLKTICDFDNDKSKKLNTKFPEVSIENKCQTILENDDINIVSIASYDNVHISQIVKALESGKHVMSEKPLCLNRSEMLEIYKSFSKEIQDKLDMTTMINELLNRDIKVNIVFVEGGWCESDSYSDILIYEEQMKINKDWIHDWRI